MGKIKSNANATIKVQRISIAEFLITFLVLAISAGGQIVIHNSYLGASKLPIGYSVGMTAYLVVIALLLCFYINRERFKTFGRPLKALGEAASKVAGGDFSIRLDPSLTVGKEEFVDHVYDDFNKMVEELGSIETLKNDFVSNVSHEIKTPLSVVQNYASALRNENITPEQRQEYTDTIIAAAERLNTLVSNILKLSKLENQIIIPTIEEYDLCGQLAECVLSFDYLLADKNIAFSAEMDDRAVIRADKSMLEIVWNNLLANAVKFTEPGGTVKLTQTSGEDTVTVIVSDTGCGMDEAATRRVFDKFYQEDASHSREGNGLGLALAYRVVALSGGEISVKSKRGEGSSFTVSLKTKV